MTTGVTILDTIIARKHAEVATASARRSLKVVQAMAEEQEPPRDFYKSLINVGTARSAVIAECKKQSPSAGIIRLPYDPVAIATSYELAGAAAISVLTDSEFFGGSLDDLVKVKAAVSIPVLRKDFIVDQYQIYEARAAGADTVLLIAGVLDLAQLQYFIEISRELGMEPLVETHNQAEVDIARGTDAMILGVNCRDLKTFRVDLEHLKQTAATLTAERTNRLLVAESGIKVPDDIEQLTAIGYKAFLVGETLLRSPDCGRALRELIRT